MALILLMTTCSPQKTAHEKEPDTYTCPMHPSVISDKPGTCPLCGMDLVKRTRPGEEAILTTDLANLIKSPNESVISSAKTIKGEYKPVPVSVAATGIVTYDTKNIVTIPSRTGGRLEKIYLQYEFQPVSQGQKIAEIYSPELLTAQREVLFLLESDPGNKALIGAAKDKLALLGLSSVQIDDLIRRKEVSYTLALYSPYSGYVITGEKTPAPSVASGSATPNDGMRGTMGATALSSATDNYTPETNAPLMIREGNYVAAGQTLFRMVSAKNLRIELDVSQAQAGEVKKGDPITLDLGNGNHEQATVDFVQPFFNEGQRFVKLRVFTRNTGLRIGQLIAASIQLASDSALWIPKGSVLDLGNSTIVFVKEHDSFIPAKVVTGISSEGLVEIKSGLTPSDEIAASASYLVDSESFIKLNN